MFNVSGTTEKYPDNLLSAEEAAARLKYGITAESLTHYADAGLAPHWRVNGGPPLFAISELKSWAAANLLQRINGKDVPRQFEFRVTYAPPPLAARESVPCSIAGLAGLCDITDAMRICAGVYFLCHGNEVVYIGQSVNAASRIVQDNGHKEFDRVFFLPVAPPDLDRVEGTFIHLLRPKLNGGALKGRLCAPHVEAHEQESIIASLMEAETR